mgnify:FL=1
MPRQFLHARHPALPHPMTEKKMVFDAPPPAELVEVLQKAGISWTKSKRA